MGKFSNTLSLLGNGRVKCDWCGRTYKQTTDIPVAGLISMVAHAVKHNFCSDACKTAYNAAHGK
jgi:hypothetical protein